MIDPGPNIHISFRRLVPCPRRLQPLTLFAQHKRVALFTFDWHYQASGGRHICNHGYLEQVLIHTDILRM